MGRRGPAPKPTALKRLQGNPGKRALNDSEPRPTATMPRCPTHLQGEARAEWRRVARGLHDAGLLTQIDRAALHPSTAPHQADAIRWALRVGRALIAMSFGLGKTHVQIEIARQVVERVGGRFLIVCPLGVRHQFIDDDGPRLGARFQYVRTDEEVAAATTPYLITNYERVRGSSCATSSCFFARL